MAGTCLVIDDAVDEVLVGSDPDCRLSLDLPGVSPIHARVWRDLGGMTVYDTRSPRGVYVNDARIVDQAPLHDGDVLWLGPPGDPDSVMIQCRLPEESILGAPVAAVPIVEEGPEVVTAAGAPSRSPRHRSPTSWTRFRSRRPRRRTSIRGRFRAAPTPMVTATVPPAAPTPMVTATVPPAATETPAFFEIPAFDDAPALVDVPPVAAATPTATVTDRAPAPPAAPPPMVTATVPPAAADAGRRRAASSGRRSSRGLRHGSRVGRARHDRSPGLATAAVRYRCASRRRAPAGRRPCPGGPPACAADACGRRAYRATDGATASGGAPPLIPAPTPMAPPRRHPSGHRLRPGRSTPRHRRRHAAAATRAAQVRPVAAARAVGRRHGLGKGNPIVTGRCGARARASVGAVLRGLRRRKAAGRC